jgi:hypothetical protein
VNVLYGQAGGLSGAGGRLFFQVGSAPETFDQFGAALAAGDFDQDGFADLAAGAPTEAVGSISSAGAVSVLYGSAGGLSTVGGRLFTQVGSAAEAGDSFGASLASGDFNHDSFTDLAAAAPTETVGSAFSAGAVSALYGTGGGLSSSGGQLFTQTAPGSQARPRSWTASAGSPSWPDSSPFGFRQQRTAGHRGPGPQHQPAA